MIDRHTKEKIAVLINEQYGPYIHVETFEDAIRLEEYFDEVYHITYWMSVPDDLGGKTFYFGSVADPEKLQAILDSIELS